MRWQEQVTLLTYEMHWTIRYFIYMSRKWDPSYGQDPGSLNIGPGLDCTALYSEGGLSYRRRKQADWADFSKKADSIFKKVNMAYQSPL